MPKKAKLTVRKRQMGKLRFGCKIEKVPVRICVIRPTSCIEEKGGAAPLIDRFLILRERGIRFFVLDMSLSGFGGMYYGISVYIKENLDVVAGEMVIACPNKETKEKLQIRGFCDVFRVFPTVKKALKGFE